MKNSCCKFRFLIPLFILGFLALFSFAVYELWNHVLVDVLGVKTITYWQALGILVLAKILFGGFPFRRGGPGPFGPPWRHHKMMEHWQSLTPEQREKMREEMGRRCGGWPDPS
jgi:Ca2+/H+ antiporter, TMEM165/GDT1 family